MAVAVSGNNKLQAAKQAADAANSTQSPEQPGASKRSSCGASALNVQRNDAAARFAAVVERHAPAQERVAGWRRALSNLLNDPCAPFLYCTLVYCHCLSSCRTLFF